MTELKRRWKHLTSQASTSLEEVGLWLKPETGSACTPTLRGTTRTGGYRAVIGYCLDQRATGVAWLYTAEPENTPYDSTAL